MRIISGKLRGRRFQLPSGRWKTRPTTDRAKESLFNILQNYIELEDIEVLDLFAGTGNIGFEFISRGAKKVSFIEKFKGCVQFIQKTLDDLDVAEFGFVLKSDVFRFLDAHIHNYDVIFADPPYALGRATTIPDLVFERKLLKPEGWLVLEHDAKMNFEKHAHFVEYRQYGQSFFSLFQ